MPFEPDGIDPYYHRYAGRLAIPNLNAAGNVVYLKFRALGDEEPKYDGMAIPTRLFNLYALSTANDTVALVEGEIDAISMTEIGIPAVSVGSGASSWKPHHAKIFAGFERIVMIADNDKPGHDLQKKIMATGLPVQPASPPGGCNDVNEALVAGYREELRKLVTA